MVDERPPKPARKPGTGTKPAQKPVVKVEVEEPDFEVVDDDDERPRKKKSSDDDDGNGKTKVVVVFVDRDDDDDDDEPRKKKSKKKSKKKRRDDDDDDWYPQGGGGGGGPFAKGKTGALLMGISFWLNLGALGVLALYSLIGWIMINGSSGGSSSSSSSRGGGDGDGSFLDVIVILPGLVGLGAWIVGTIGCAFAIAGPAKARGMAITATVFAGVHLLLTGITFSNFQDGLGIARGMPGLGKIAWIFVASTLPALDSLLPMLFYSSKSINGDYVIIFLASICEVLRLVFMLMTLKALSEAAKDYGAAEKSHFSMMTAIMILGGAALGTLLMAVLLREGGFKSISTYANLAVVTVFLMYLAYTFMMLGPALAAMQTKDACDRRS